MIKEHEEVNTAEDDECDFLDSCATNKLFILRDQSYLEFLLILEDPYRCSVVLSRIQRLDRNTCLWRLKVLLVDEVLLSDKYDPLDILFNEM